MGNTFDEISKQIQATLEEEEKNVNVPVKGDVPVDAKGMPDVNKVTSGQIGKLVSKPGTEKVTLNAKTFQLLTCVSNAKGREKPRYCVVEKGVSAKYGNQYITSTGNLAHVITKQLYQLLFGVFSTVNKQVTSLQKDLSYAEEKRDLYKMTIDALKKNGVID